MEYSNPSSTTRPDQIRPQPSFAPWPEWAPHLERMVRRVVRFGPGRSVLEQKIQREVIQITSGPEQKDLAGPSDVIGKVTCRLLQEWGTWMEQPADPGSPWQETVGIAPAWFSPTRVETKDVSLALA